MITRRGAIGGALALVACGEAPRAPIDGRIANHGDAARGHRVREARPTSGRPDGRVDVLIVGAGVAGLSAAWRLAKRGFSGTVRIVEVGEGPGGTAAGATGPRGPHPTGAHYVTLPSPEAVDFRQMLADFGVITGFDADGRPRYDPTALCFAPEERLWVRGRWFDSLWPSALCTAEDERQRAAFEAEVVAWRDRIGADGRPAFAVPVASSSGDPEIRALADRSFAAWLTARGYDSLALRWKLSYDVRDDYGADLDAVSAWAGLHYHAARRPDPAEPDLGTRVLTWASGNGWLVDALRARIPWAVEPRIVARAVDVGPGGLRVLVDRDGDLGEIGAGAVILAVPSSVAGRLVGRDGWRGPDTAPWRVAALSVTRRPAGPGAPPAWDNVVYGAAGLGYVDAGHNALRRFDDGPRTLVYYAPVAGPPAEARAGLLGATWEAEAQRVLDDLAPAVPEIAAITERIDVWHHGHGTVIPAVGLHGPGRLDALAAGWPERVFVAHTDLSGLSLFEEASFHGIRAADAVLA